MKKTLLMTTLAVSLLAPVQGFASEDTKIDHYEGKVFETKIDAKTTLAEKTEEVAKIVEADDLDITKMEQIHEISYTMEDAVEVISNDSDFDFTKLSEALEEMHLASEDHEADKIKASFESYSAEFEKFKESAKTN